MPIYSTGRRKDGKTQYRVRINYTDTSGTHRQKEASCYGHQEALDLERQMLIKYSGKLPDGELTVAEFFELYKKMKSIEVRETTLAKCASNISLHIIPLLGDIPLMELNERAISDWKSEMVEKGLSVAYCRRVWGELNGMLNRAVKLKYIPENPTKNLENFRDIHFVASENKLHFYTPDQFIHFAVTANAAVENYLQRSIFIFLMIAYYTGLRKGEIHALRWNDIQGNVLHVRRSVSQKVKGKSTVETPPKNKTSIRDVQLPQPLLSVLAQYKLLQQLQYPQKWNNRYRICFGPKCLSDTSISNYNIKWAKLAELPVLRIHDYRHSHASLLANEGINIQEIARRLGHSNVQITWQRYSHLYPREEERALKVLNKLTIPELSPNL